MGVIARFALMSLILTALKPVYAVEAAPSDKEQKVEEQKADKEKPDQKKKQAVWELMVIVTVLITLVFLCLLWWTHWMGRRTRLITQEPLKKLSPPDPLWFLKNKRTPPTAGPPDDSSK